MDAAPEPTYLPSWLRRGDPESVVPVVIALIGAMALQLLIPERYTAFPRWPLLTLEALLLLVLIGINPLRLVRSNPIGNQTRRVLLAAITVDNTASAVLLNYHILAGKEVSNSAAILLGSGTAIFITNIIVFGIWYWELDSGGPFARFNGERAHPDFMFPQMASPELAPHNWRPLFIDYFYVALTNVMAFSPTDTMPLARWAKVMMAVQALVAVSNLVLVVARAVNVLG